MDINFANMSDLNRTVSAAFREALAKAPEIEWPKLATRIPSSSSENLYPFLNETDGMREWFGDALFDQLASTRYAIANRKFQKGLIMDRDQIKDDQDGGAGLYSGMAAVVARACASHPDELTIAEVLANGETLLCHDGQPMFDNSHPNQNGDGGVQDNLLEGGGTPWYLFDTSAAIRPLIYQPREELVLEPNFDMTNEVVYTQHKFRYNAWMRDAAGFGPWFTAVKSKATLDEAGYVAARARLEGFHMGIKDPLTDTYRSARARAGLLVVPYSLRDTARKLITQGVLATGEENYLKDTIEIHVSRYL